MSAVSNMAQRRDSNKEDTKFRRSQVSFNEGSTQKINVNSNSELGFLSVPIPELNKHQSADAQQQQS